MEQVELNVDSFDLTWETVRDTHWDPDLNGVDWEAARSKYRPRVLAARSMSSAREPMREMLQELGQSHFRVIPGAAEVEPEESLTDRIGSVGLSVRVIDGRALVTRVWPQMPASDAGIRQGWELVAVGRTSVNQHLRGASQRFANPASSASFAVAELLVDAIGQRQTLAFEDGSGQRVVHSLTYTEPLGEAVGFGHMRQVHSYIQSRTLAAGRVGYLEFNLFLNPPILMSAMEDLVQDCEACTGIILDLRGNPGGLGALAMGIAGFFVAESGQSLGSMMTRDVNFNFIVFPRARPFRGKLAVLVDSMSASTAEILAGGLQDLQRARLFGERTAGAALPSQIVALPNGDRLQHAVANFVRPDGRSLEGVGVMPDELIVPSQVELLLGQDPVLESAEGWILGRPGTTSALE